jgi:PLP dependent protein
MPDLKKLQDLLKITKSFNATLIAVSKTRSAEKIREVYESGHLYFGENYVQEIVQKHAILSQDIEWHFIGHLQSNKVKLIAPFVKLIHGVDSLRLAREISRFAEEHNRIINILLQVHIAEEETKFGLSETETTELHNILLKEKLPGIVISGLMGMATLTDNVGQLRKEFRSLRQLFETLQKDQPDLSVLSMGMSSDYLIALEEGSTMVRIGSAIFGERK